MLEYCRLLTSTLFFQKFFSVIPSVSTSLDPDQARRCVGHDLGPNCFQSLDDKTMAYQSAVVHHCDTFPVRSKLYVKCKKIVCEMYTKQRASNVRTLFSWCFKG